MARPAESRQAPVPINYGVWIDHGRAHIVEVNGSEVRVDSVESQILPRTKTTGGTRMPGKTYMKAAISSEKNNENFRKESLARYYRDIAGRLAHADRILIMGPGEAKLEFAKALSKKSRRLGGCIEDVETTGKLTERQLVARIRKYFEH